MEDAARQGIIEMPRNSNYPAAHDKMVKQPQLNSRYLHELMAMPKVLAFVVRHRLCKIQKHYRERYELRTFAATLIKKKWKVYRQAKDSRAIRRAAVSFLMKKAAISKIARFSKTIKVRKVTTKALLNLD